MYIKKAFSAILCQQVWETTCLWRRFVYFGQLGGLLASFTFPGFFSPPSETSEQLKCQWEEFFCVQAYWSLICVCFFIAMTVQVLRSAEPFFNNSLKSKRLFDISVL
jgi:hypothetical protein